MHCSGDIPEALAAAPVSLCSVPVLQQLSSNSSKDAQSLVLNRRLRLPPVTASDANGRLYCAGRSSIKISARNKSLLELAIPNSELIRLASIAMAEFRNRLFVENGKLRATFTKPLKMGGFVALNRSYERMAAAAAAQSHPA
jgi:hypothetical protein